MSDTTTGSREPMNMWLAIVLGFILTLGVMIACAYLWVYLYSVFINSSGDNAFYEAYAQIASPIVAVVVAFPVFYYAGRFMRRYGEKATFAVMAVVGMNLALDAAVVATMAADSPFNVMISLLAAMLKIGGAWMGTRRSGSLQP